MISLLHQENESTVIYEKEAQDMCFFLVTTIHTCAELILMKQSNIEKERDSVPQAISCKETLL